MSPTEYVGLKRMEELLTCGICYEYMDTTVITSCSHNYCSLCIRRYLHYKTQCPTCSEETFEKDLRKNKILDEIIEQYLNIKEQLEKKSRGEQTPTTKDKNSGSVCSLEGTPSTPCGQKDHQQDASTPSTSTELRIPKMFTPKSRKGFRNEKDCQVVACPVCRVDVPQININKHLDDCLKRKNAKDQSQSVKPRRKPLPKLVLSLMKDNVIRKKLKELGLSSQGDRKALEYRLQRYTVLYNAECDRTNPRPVSELIKQCEEEESLERKVQKPSNRLNINRNTERNVIEQQRKKYLADNKDSFNHLVTSIKHSNGSQKLPIRRNILSLKNCDVPDNKSCVAEDSPTGEKSDVRSSANRHIDDSDSNASCPLQTYSSEDAMNFLKVELSSSSNDSTDQCAANDASSRSRKTSPLSSARIIKEETEEALEDVLVHEETISNYWSYNEYNVPDDRLDSVTEESIGEFIRSEFEDKDKIVSSAKRCKHGTTCSPHDIIHVESENRRQEESCDEDSIVEISDNDDIQGDCERPRHELLHAKAKEKCESGGTKFEKENFDLLDEIKKVRVVRKREREATIALSDGERNGGISTSIRKSTRLGLSEAKGFNNGIFHEDTRNEEENPQSEKRQLRATRTKSPRGVAKRTVKSKNNVIGKSKKKKVK